MGDSLRHFHTESVRDTDDCMIWPYAKSGAGYGQLRIDGRTVYIHTLVCESEHGPRPVGYQAAHSCGNPSCFNRRHVSWKTPRENQADRVAHGTDLRGERQPRHKLTVRDVFDIRRRAREETQASLAREYQVNPWTIHAIVNRKVWAWLDEEVS
jgi:hypothetical protein